MKEIIGRFAVTDKHALEMWVVVVQELQTDKTSLVARGRKSFQLHGLEGYEIYPTETPSILVHPEYEHLWFLTTLLNR